MQLGSFPCLAPAAKRLSGLPAICACWLMVLGLLALGKFRGDPRGLFHLGTNFPHPPSFAFIPRIGPWGYDGQFYAALATDPFLRRPETAAYLDSPAYRARRLGLPLLAYLLAFGQPALAAWTYLFLGGLLTFVGLAATAALLRDWRLPPWTLWLVAANVGLAASLTRSTPDAPAAALLLPSWWADSRSRPLLGGSLAVFAVLTRETMLLGVGLYALRGFLRTGRWSQLLPPALGGGLCLVWACWLQRAFPDGSGVAGLRGNLHVPGLGLWEKVRLLLQRHDVHAMEVTALLGLLMLLLGTALASGSLRQEQHWALAGFAVLALALGSKVYVEAFAYSRVLLPLAWTAVLAPPPQPWARTLALAGLCFQALAGLFLLHGEFLPLGGLLATLKEAKTTLWLWLFSR